MARSIVLRFDATCHDCGRPLSAGTTARWFGKGRVSCCGGNGAQAPAPAAAPAAQPMRIAPPGDSASIYRAARDAASFGAATSGIDAQLAQAVKIGLSPAQLARLAEVAPLQQLCVRLTSGARFGVAARDAVHVIRCIEESCVDHVRDVMGAAQ